MKHFSCESEYMGDSSAVITVEGELDLDTAGQLRGTLEKLQDLDISDHLVLDLSGVTFMDSTALSVLVTAQKQAEGPLHVVATSREVLRVLHVTNLDTVFVLYATRVEAVDAMRARVPGL